MSRIDLKKIMQVDAVLKERYSRRLGEFGHDPRTLGWDTRQNQHVRFALAAKTAKFTGASVLDVGCGLADFYEFLVGHNSPPSKYTGLDITPELIKFCKQTYPQCEFIEGNLLLESPVSNKFDIVCMFGLLNFRFGEFENKIFAEDMIAAAFEMAQDCVVVDMLSNRIDEGYQVENFVHYYDPAEMLEFALSLTPYVELRHDYRPIPQREFMLILKKFP